MRLIRQAHTVAVNGENLDEPYISEPVEKQGILPIQSKCRKVMFS